MMKQIVKIAILRKRLKIHLGMGLGGFPRKFELVMEETNAAAVGNGIPDNPAQSFLFNEAAIPGGHIMSVVKLQDTVFTNATSVLSNGQR
jgi:hypothetical protein